MIVCSFVAGPSWIHCELESRFFYLYISRLYYCSSDRCWNRPLGCTETSCRSRGNRKADCRRCCSFWRLLCSPVFYTKSFKTPAGRVLASMVQSNWWTQTVPGRKCRLPNWKKKLASRKKTWEVDAIRWPPRRLLIIIYRPSWRPKTRESRDSLLSIGGNMDKETRAYNGTNKMRKKEDNFFCSIGDLNETKLH